MATSAAANLEDVQSVDLMTELFRLMKCSSKPDKRLILFGDQVVKVLAVHASVHLPNDHRMLVQNLSAQVFNNASIPTSVQAAFPYIFAVSKFLQVDLPLLQSFTTIYQQLRAGSPAG